MEAEGSHICICNPETRRASGVIQTEAEGLRTGGAHSVSPSAKQGRTAVGALAHELKAQEPGARLDV